MDEPIDMNEVDGYGYAYAIEKLKRRERPRLNRL